jgi:hypothetical protein
MTVASSKYPSVPMSPVRLTLGVLIVVAITCASALLAGSYNQRFGRPEALVQAAASIERIPEQFGPWELQVAQPLPPESVEMLECAGHTSRTYRHRETGQIVNMFVIVGPPGPTAVHTPEICYSSRDFSIEARRAKVSLATPQHSDSSVWELTLRGNDVHADELDVVYAWNAGAGWHAADAPRYQFSGRPYLYKLQAAGVVDASQSADREPCRAFVADLLPVLDEVLATPDAATDR